MTRWEEHPETPTGTTGAVPWSRYVAIGDSLTEGMCDPDPQHDDRFIGWADRLAGILDQANPNGIGYANLAIRGRLLAPIIAEQLEPALALRPDLVSLLGGTNDLLRPNVDVDALAATLEDAVIRLRTAGVDVLLATQIDPRKAAFFRRLRPRYAIYTSHLHTIAGRHGCYLVDLWGLDEIRQRGMWAPDLLHLSTEGHILVANAAAAALRIPTGSDAEPVAGPGRVADPGGARRRRLSRARRNAGWVGEHLLPWLGRRLSGRSSGDLVRPKRPDLTAP